MSWADLRRSPEEVRNKGDLRQQRQPEGGGRIGPPSMMNSAPREVTRLRVVAWSCAIDVCCCSGRSHLGEEEADETRVSHGVNVAKCAECGSL